MRETGSNTERLAKNTLVLFFRMLFTVLISLYSSRVVLQALGASDYGLYNLVGGVVAMFSIITTSLSVAISRFLTFELGTGNESRLKQVFSAAMITEGALILIVFVLVETVGVWFLHNGMKIAPESIKAAEVILQCSMGTFLFSLAFVPFNACVVAHERMQLYAFTSIAESLLKLGLVLYLAYSTSIHHPKLNIYALGLLLISVAVQSVTIIYSIVNFKECRFTARIEKGLFGKMLGFAGWNFFGSAASMFNSQGLNIVLNMVGFATVVNAARGLAVTVNNVMCGFVNSFTMALNPQITKSYASGDMDGMLKLVFRGAKFSFFILFAVSLPLILETGFVLDLWLVNIPEYTVQFIRLVLITSLVEILSSTLGTSQNATGEMKIYQIVISVIQFASFAVSAIILKLGGSPLTPYLVWLPLATFGIFARIYILAKYIPISHYSYFRNVLVPVCETVAAAAPVSYLCRLVLPSSVVGSLAAMALAVVFAVLASGFIGCSKDERAFVGSLFKGIIGKANG